MLDMILHVLTVLGIILLILLTALTVIILLVLFFPVSYRFYGRKEDGSIRVSVKLKWLFGVVRAKYDYPDTGHLTVWALFFTLYDTIIPGGGQASEEETKPKKSRKKEKRTRRTKKQTVSETISNQKSTETEGKSQENLNTEKDSGEDENESNGSEEPAVTDEAQDNAEASEDGVEAAPKGKIFLKFEKIKYTIYRIYDKIKNIWKNISYYIELLREEETKMLFGHVLFRCRKVLKNIRPRRVRSEILFGTGSPDTTGYIYGIYCVLTSVTGRDLRLTPDFENAVLRGELYVAGHITLWTLIWNGLMLFWDKKLQSFLDKMKKKV